jgi:hypothetical protein
VVAVLTALPHNIAWNGTRQNCFGVSEERAVVRDPEMWLLSAQAQALKAGIGSPLAWVLMLATFEVIFRTAVSAWLNGKIPDFADVSAIFSFSGLKLG